MFTQSALLKSIYALCISNDHYNYNYNYNYILLMMTLLEYTCLNTNHCYWMVTDSHPLMSFE
jgi:hypothetical protein